MEWISCEIGLPSDGKLCWINTKRWGVMMATFLLKDQFERANMFVNTQGGFMSIDEVAHYQEIDIPKPPKTDL